MTQPEYEQKKRECWEEFKNAAFNGNTSYSTCSALDFAFDRAYALGKQEKDADDTVISGWVARDNGKRSYERELHLFTNKPERRTLRRDWFGLPSMSLDSKLFPDLTWYSEPLEVEIIIKKTKK